MNDVSAKIPALKVGRACTANTATTECGAAQPHIWNVPRMPLSCVSGPLATAESLAATVVSNTHTHKHTHTHTYTHTYTHTHTHTQSYTQALL